MTTATKAEPKASEAATEKSAAGAKPDTNGHITKSDLYRREIGSELAGAMSELDELTRDWAALKAETADAKKEVDGAQRRVNRLAAELRDIENGTFQPRLVPVAKDADEPKTDAGAALPISEFANFGLTAKEVEKIANCPCHPKTIGEFEEWQRGDELWNTKIKGFGEEKITKLQDAHAALRLQYPMPTDDDDGEDAEDDVEAEDLDSDDGESED